MLIKEYESIDNLLQNLDKIKGTKRKTYDLNSFLLCLNHIKSLNYITRLEAHVEGIQKALKLLELKKDIEVPISLDGLQRKSVEREQVTMIM